jgi:hypothetical protein
MHITARQEQFSRSAVYAIASRAGCAVSERNVDDDSIDLTLCSKMLSRRPSVDIQLKCTHQDVLRETELTYPLSRKNYDDLRFEDLLVPRILIVVLVPAEINDWLHLTEERMLVRGCGYWRSLRGAASTENISTVAIAVPREQMFTPDALTQMMQTIHDGGTL